MSGPSAPTETREGPRLSRLAAAALVLASLLPLSTLAMAVAPESAIGGPAGAVVLPAGMADAVVAIVLAVIALVQIRRHPSQVTGASLAVWALVLTVPLVAVYLVLPLFARVRYP